MLPADRVNPLSDGILPCIQHPRQLWQVRRSRTSSEESIIRKLRGRDSLVVLTGVLQSLMADQIDW